MNFGQFVDLEYLLAHGTDKALPKILEKLNANYEYTQEALYVVETYIKWRTNLYKQYSALFGLDELQDDVEPTVTAKSRQPYKVAAEWYRLMVELANDDILKIRQITELQVKEVLNFMAVRKEKRLAEARKQKEQKKQYDLQRARR